jgi:hypothetical protein
MNCKKINISMPPDLHDWLVEHVAAINRAGKSVGSSTNKSNQIALAVSLLKEKEEAQSKQGKAQLPQPSKDALAPIAHTSVLYSSPRKHSRTK